MRVRAGAIIHGVISATESSPTDDLGQREHVDVLIVGAGISGIGCAYYLQRHHPRRSYAILEGRERIGGTARWRT